jgi:hypothetical protein
LAASPHLQLANGNGGGFFGGNSVANSRANAVSMFGPANAGAVSIATGGRNNVANAQSSAFGMTGASSNSVAIAGGK